MRRVSDEHHRTRLETWRTARRRRDQRLSLWWRKYASASCASFSSRNLSCTSVSLSGLTRPKLFGHNLKGKPFVAECNITIHRLPVACRLMFSSPRSSKGIDHSRYPTEYVIPFKIMTTGIEVWRSVTPTAVSETVWTIFQLSLMSEVPIQRLLPGTSALTGTFCAQSAPTHMTRKIAVMISLFT
jgi:hypothetical protein